MPFRGYCSIGVRQTKWIQSYKVSLYICKIFSLGLPHGHYASFKKGFTYLWVPQYLNLSCPSLSCFAFFVRIWLLFFVMGFLNQPQVIYFLFKKYLQGFSALNLGINWCAKLCILLFSFSLRYLKKVGIVTPCNTKLSGQVFHQLYSS